MPPLLNLATLPAILAALLLTTTTLTAQSPQPTPHPIALRAALVFGQQNEGYTGGDTNAAILTLGLAAESSRRPLHPGLDLRCICAAYGVRGALLGPTIAASSGPARVYAEALFGPNHVTQNQTYPLPPLDLYGFSATGVLGLDLQTNKHVYWRILEGSFGAFTGVPGAHPRSLSTGIVLRFQ